MLQETGVAAALLRAWERRYGLPQPERTPGGHRLYSARDIALVRWLREQQRRGMAISHAVALWRQLEAEGRDPLLEEGYSLSALPEAAAGLAELRRAWIDACARYDGALAGDLLRQALGLAPMERVALDLLQPALAEFGERWAVGEVTVHQEHFASEMAVRSLENLVASLPPAHDRRRVLLGAPAGEWHTFSPLLLTLLLRRAGHEVVYLGIDLPLEYLEQTVRELSPALVVLSAQMLHSAASLRQMALALHVTAIPLGYGGRIFNELPSLQPRIPGHFLGTTLEQAAGRIRQLLDHPEPVLEVSRSPRYEELAALFRRCQSEVQGRVLSRFQPVEIPPERLIEVNHWLADSLHAALQLGEPAGLAHDLAWVGTLLRNRDLSENLLQEHLREYRQAVRELLGGPGEEIAVWLEITPDSLVRG